MPSDRRDEKLGFTAIVRRFHLSLIVEPFLWAPLQLFRDSRKSDGQRCNGELAELSKRNDRAVWATFLLGRLITFPGPLVAASPGVDIAGFGFCRN